MRLEDINLRDSITIAYYDPFSVFLIVREELQARLPLSNLHWRYNPLRPIKSIPLLPASFVEEVPVKHKHEFTLHPLIDSTYLRLVFVKVDSIEVYRSQIRPLICAWLTDLVKGRDISWGIVLVNVEGLKDKGLALRMSMYEKVRADFGPSGKQLAKLGIDPPKNTANDEDEVQENIFRLGQHYENDLAKLEAYNILIAHTKSLVLRTFDTRFGEVSQQITNLTEKAQSNDTALVHRFSIKSQLAYMLADLRLFSESLETHEELEKDLDELQALIPDNFSNASVDILVYDYSNFDPEIVFSQRNLTKMFVANMTQKVPINIAQAKLDLLVSLLFILQSLSNFSTSISVSSLYIADLLKRLHRHLNAISLSSDANLLAWCYAMADFYLNLPLTKTLLEMDEKVSDETTHVSAIMDASGTMRLFMRSTMGKLARVKGLQSSEIFEDVSLSESKFGVLTLEYPFVDKTLISQTSYDQYFEEITVAAMQNFNACERVKTIDVLSVDLAVMQYRRGQYQQALDILLDSHQYFIQLGWKYMGAELLELYLDCVQKLNSTDLGNLIENSLRLFAALKVPTSGASNIGFLTDARSADLFERVCLQSENLKNHQNFSLDELFHTQVIPFVDVEGEYLVVQLKVENVIPLQFKFHGINVTLTDADDQELNFACDEITLRPSSMNEFKLKCPDFRESTFSVSKIEFIATRKLSLVQERKSHPEGDETVIRYTKENEIVETATSSSGTPMHIYPFFGTFGIELKQPEQIEIGASKFRLVAIGGKTTLRALKVFLTPKTLTLKILQDHFEVEELGASSKAEFEVNFNHTGDEKSLNISVYCEYLSGLQKHQYHSTKMFASQLALSVSVQDIFRETAIYSKFQFAAAENKSIVRLLNCLLNCPQGRYSIHSLQQNFDPVLVFSEQPAQNVHKIIPTSKIEEGDVLDLQVCYSPLQIEAAFAVATKLKEETESRNCEKFYYLLEEVVSAAQFDLTSLATDGILAVTNFDEVHESCVLKVERSVLDSGVQSSLIDAVSAALKTEGLTTMEQPQYLLVPVPMPNLEVFLTASVEFDERAQYCVGAPIEAIVKIHCLTNWASQSAEAYELHMMVPNDENWLVSGIRKQTFTTKADSSHETKLCLVPLTVGEILLPRISVKSVNQASLEMIFKNGMKTILVVPEQTSISLLF